MYLAINWSCQLQSISFVFNKERSLAWLVVHRWFHSDLTSTHNVVETEGIIDIQVVSDLNFLEHVEVLSNFDIFGGNFSELVIDNGNIDGVVNIRPVGVRTCFLAVLWLSLHEVGCFFEVCELKFFADCVRSLNSIRKSKGKTYASGPSSTYLGESGIGSDASLLS